jgi:SOS-response transcriptional repressor LexA
MKVNLHIFLWSAGAPSCRQTFNMPEKRVNPKWFRELYAEGIRIAGSANALATQLGLAHPTVSDWLKKDAEPKMDAFVALLEYVGGSIERAFPTWELPRTGEAPTLPLVGSVAAGAFDWNGAGDIEDIECWPDQWKRSKYWDLTLPPKKAKGSQAVLVRVYGDSMEPAYSPDELLVCREPKNIDDLPDRTPCIFRIRGEGQTFKLLRLTHDGSYFAEPINPAHRCILLSKEKDVEVPLVVVGKFDPGTAQKRSTRLTGIAGLTRGMK